MAKMKIAQALLLRKQLDEKVRQLAPIKQLGDNGLFEIKTQRKSVGTDVDEVTFQVPKITLGAVTAEYDKFASALRKLDASVQKANWEFEVDFTDEDNPIK